MNDYIIHNTSQILKYSILIYAASNDIISFGRECIALDNYKASKKKGGGNKHLNYFLLTKYRSVEENVLYSAKILYDLIGDSRIHVDKLFLDFASKQAMTININIERILYLSLTFLFSLGKITVKNNMIERL